jgi:ABC-type Na+ efflux pump permease subunit
MVVSAIAMGKQNKTSATLLTVPILRTSIVTTKMLAVGAFAYRHTQLFLLLCQDYIINEILVSCRSIWCEPEHQARVICRP